LTGKDKQTPQFGEDLDGTGLRVGVVASRFNESITKLLVQGASDGLSRHGVADDDVTLVWVPGAFELSLVAKHLAASGRYDAVICLGAVIRGETAHFDFVAGQAADGIARAALDTGVPVIFGVLTTDTVEQAEARAAPDRGNKGYEAALSAIDMATLLRTLPEE
jgi:6,7-dimethyl-8-ribityllumazine synthase